MSRVLYISYDGMLEPLGQSQVIGYLERLAERHDISLLSFEKKHDREDAARVAAVRGRLEAAGIRWTPLAYHKAPSLPATLYDVSAGTAVALRIARARRIEIVHARALLPAMMAMPVKRLTGARFIFDMRAFWVDERVDGGLWPKGRLYRVMKGVERRALIAADQIVTLTRASVDTIRGFDFLKDRDPALIVIPTCADLDRFALRSAPPEGPFIFGYVGSTGTWYLFDETLAFFRALQERRPDARLLVVNRNDHDAVRAAVAKAGIDADRLELVAAEHGEVPGHVARMHAAGSVIRPCFSKLASAPTKLAEYLGTGVPCVGNTGVGDMESILEGHRVGVALTDFSEADLARGVERLLALTEDPATPGRCREAAESLFSLEKGVASYDAIYAALSKRG